MAKKTQTKHKQIDAEESDDFAKKARLVHETSNDGKFSTYEYAEKKDPRDGDLILQYRGAPSK